MIRHHQTASPARHERRDSADAFVPEDLDPRRLDDEVAGALGEGFVERAISGESLAPPDLEYSELLQAYGSRSSETTDTDFYEMELELTLDRRQRATRLVGGRRMTDSKSPH